MKAELAAVLAITKRRYLQQHRAALGLTIPALPVVGFLGTGSQKSDAFRVTAVRQGLIEAGYVEGRNVAFEHSWAEDQYERLPALATDLVRREVAVR